MPPLLPSEVARLVYGQLEHCNCSNIAEQFLNESPHLEECREFVKSWGKPCFLTKAYGLSLQQILERYLDMWNLILDQTNDIIPDTQEKFADPVKGLKYLLSSYDKTSNEADDCPFPPLDAGWKNILTETSSEFSLRVDPSPDTVENCEHEQLNLNHSQESAPTRLDTFDVHNEQSFPRYRKQNRYLDKLYASTESLENPGKKKKLKVLRPRQAIIDNSSTSHSTLQDSRGSAINANLVENNMTHPNNDCNAKEFVLDEKLGEFPVVSRTTQLTANSSKGTNMQLRSSSKKRKYSYSPERAGGPSKQPKTSKSMIGKENDAQVDFAKIPQLLIDDPKWPELIAENINKKISESPQKKIDTHVEEVIESIAEKTLADDLTDEFIRGLLNCAQNITQEKNSDEPNITLDANPHEVNLNCVNSMVANEMPQNGNVDIPVSEPTDSNNQIYRDTDYSRLRGALNEFVGFNDAKGNSELSKGDTNCIVIGMTETTHTSVQPCNPYLTGAQNHSVHSNYVVCSTQEPLAGNENDLRDEIITLHAEPNNLEWNVQTISSIVTPVPPNNINLKQQILTTRRTKSVKSNYRPIKPKGDICIATAPDEKNAQNRNKTLKKPRK